MRALGTIGSPPVPQPSICAQVALHETRVFLNQLMPIPGVRLERAPDMAWNQSLMICELRNAVVVCDSVEA